jgi:hypothetical protein
VEQINKLDPEDKPTRKCSRIGCNNRYPLVLRGGRNSGKAMAGRERSLHKGRRYCSDTCRKLASKERRVPLQPSPAPPLQPSLEASKEALGTIPLSTVTSVASALDVSMGYEGPKSGRAPLQMTFRRGVVVPDPDWPGMYRVSKPDGSLSDMVNLTRARDAARPWGDHE